MPAKINTTGFGHSAPPEGPHAVTVHIKGWEATMGVRDGDTSVLARLSSMYPRFAPWGLTRQLSAAVGKKLGLSETQARLVLIGPDALEQARLFTCSPLRLEHQVKDPSDLSLRVVDVPIDAETIRLYVVVGPATAAKALGVAWQTPGLGVSTRLAEALLPNVEPSLVEVPAENGGVSPAAPLKRALLETESHAALRERIASLMRRSPIDPARASMLKSQDVYLYPTGMAAILRVHELLTEHRPGKVLVLGSVFKNSWQLMEESRTGMKHFGHCHTGDQLLAELDEWLAAEAREGRAVSYCFLEFPSNPILVSADLFGLQKLADKYGFPLVVDDTVGSFANIDLLPVANIIMSSLTKSFSGYADVMGGSIVLNPSFPSTYAAISPLFASGFVNELFKGDASHLVSNSADYIERTAILNRNAAAVAAFFAAQKEQHEAASGSSIITGINYPPYTSTAANYAAVMRPATDELVPGAGCLLSVDFSTIEAAAAFYDSSQFFHGPHLGAHRSLAIPFAALAFGKKGQADTPEYHHAYGLRAAQVRISVGLEDEADVVAIAEDALAAAVEVATAAKATHQRL